LYPDGDGFFLYARVPLPETSEGILAAFQRETLAIVPPIEFHADRRMVLSLVASTEDLQAIIDTLPEEMDVEVVSVGSAPQRVRSTLTERQQAAVEAAVACGYYAVPREGSLSDVAARLDCVESTASILLRRAHRRLVQSEGDAIGRLGTR
jgi:predicted DNA binding protein